MCYFHRIRNMMFILGICISHGTWAIPVRDSANLISINGYGNELTSSEHPQYFLQPTDIQSIGIPSGEFNIPFRKFAEQMNTHPQKFNFWLKFNLKNTTGHELQTYLYCGNENYVNLYLVIAAKQTLTYRGGNMRSVNDRLPYIEQISGIIPFSLPSQTMATVYLRIKQRTERLAFPGITITDKQHLYADFGADYNQSRTDILIQILFQGFVLCQICYMFLQWLIVRRKEYFYYFCYLMMISLYFLSREESGIGIYFIFTRYPQLVVYLNKTLQILAYFLYFRFVRTFLELDQGFPGLNRWMKRIEYFLLVYLVFDLTFILFTLDTRLQYTFFLGLITLVFLASTVMIVYLFRQHSILTNYIVTGSLFVGLGNIAGLVISYLVYELKSPIHFSDPLLLPQAGVILEIICFTSGLSYKNMLSEKEKVRAQRRLIKELRSHELLQARMHGIRDKIGQDLHDDIGSTLSTILLYSNMAIMKDRSLLPDEAREILRKISISANQMIDEMNDIVWTINPRNDDMGKIISKMQFFATTITSSCNIRLEFESASNLEEGLMMMDKKKNFFLIFKEAVNNAVKYSHCNELKVSIRKTNDWVEMTVIDNGSGFDLNSPRRGNGLHNMQSRAAESLGHLDILSNPGKGTHIRLMIPLDAHDA